MIDSVTCRALALSSLLALTSGCSSLGNCSEERTDPIRIDAGETDVDAMTYESVPWQGTWPAFPAKSKLSFEHHLGFTPFGVQAYLAFKPQGTNGADAGSLSEIAGNEGLYDCIDSNVIVLRNDTCEKSFYVKVIAWDKSPTDLGDACSKKP